MTRGHAPATRFNLVRVRRRLERVYKGVDLLTRKREALIVELLKRARPAIDARQAIDASAAVAYPTLLRALALHGFAGLRALGWPTRELTVGIELTPLWGVQVPDLVERPRLRRTPGARGTAPASTGPTAAVTAERFEELAELLLDATPSEMLIRQLGEALANTTRQVNALEQRVIVDLRRELGTIRRVVEEREREQRVTLKRLVQKRKRPGAEPRPRGGG